MIFMLFRFLVDQLTSVLTLMVRSILWFSFLFSVAYSFGWVQRLLWLVLEHTASSLWNGTPVTIGSLEIDLIRGRVWATNVVIHTPRREEWGWESPLIARIGRIYVEHNWVSSFLIMLVRMACGYGQKQILELYTIEVSDVQGFIERKQHIFNFYLMDKFLDLPDPKDIIMEEEKEARKRQQQSQKNNTRQQDLFASGISNTTDGPRNNNRQHNHDNLSEASVDLSIDQDHQVEAAYAPGSSAGYSSTSRILEDEKEELLGEEEEEMAHRQAQQLVDDMFSAVKSIGRAAQKKGSLVGAFIEQREQLASKLKEFKGTKNKTEAMQKGVKVIQRVGKAVAKKTKTLHTVIPKMPNRREPDIVPVYGRVGRIVIEDARVFTRTNTNSKSHNVPSTAASAATASTSAATSVSNSTTAENSKQSTPASRKGQDDRQKPENLEAHLQANVLSSQGLGSKWNKPIGISEMILRSSELCPPNSLLDEKGLPAIYQPLDNIVDVVMKRALVGLAKNNTSRFLQTALGELLEMEYSTIFSDTDFGNAGGERQSPQPPPTSAPTYRRSGSGSII